MITFTSNPITAAGLQFINQTFNANVNFSNSSADISIITLVDRNLGFFERKKPTAKEKSLFENYLIAATGACALALGLTRLAPELEILFQGFPIVAKIAKLCTFRLRDHLQNFAICARKGNSRNKVSGSGLAHLINVF